MSAADAAALLGVSRNSLYSYVSRGRIHAEADPHDPRVSRYLAADVVRLRDRKEARLHPEAAAQKTLQWGIPVLESSVTLIESGRFYYRGVDALALARHAPFEDAVRLLWNTPDALTPYEPLSRACRETLTRLRALDPIARMQAILPVAAAEDSGADRQPAAVAASGWRMLSVLTTAATADGVASAAAAARVEPSMASRLARAWSAPIEAAGLIDMALVLCADHELNVSAFTARVVASAGSSPYDAVGAALAAVRGPLHGGHSSRVEDLLDEAGSPGRLRRVMAERMRSGERVPGFGHPLYPDGDPRARALFSAVERSCATPRIHALVQATRRAGRDVVGEHPNVDYALVVLRRALGLPRGAALTLFALARTAGWIAHAMEQYSAGGLIRPRAAYTGPRPIAAAAIRSPMPAAHRPHARAARG